MKTITAALLISLLFLQLKCPTENKKVPTPPAELKMQRAYYPCVEKSIVEVSWENVADNNGYKVYLYESKESGDSLVAESKLKKDSTYASFDYLESALYRAEVRTIALDSTLSIPIVDTVSMARQTIITDKVVFLVPNSCARSLCGLDSNKVMANEVNYYTPLYAGESNPYEGYRVVLEYTVNDSVKKAEFRFTKKHTSFSIIRDRCDYEEDFIQLLDKNINCNSREVTIVFDDNTTCKIWFKNSSFVVTPLLGFPKPGTTISVYRMRWQCGVTQEIF